MRSRRRTSDKQPEKPQRTKAETFLLLIKKLRGLILLVTLFLILAGLKIGGIINWSWLVVVIPLAVLIFMLSLPYLFVFVLSSFLGIETTSKHKR